jgi:hypothetical protein
VCVARADGATRAADDCDPDAVVRAAADRPDGVVDDHRLRCEAELIRELAPEEREVLGPVGASQAEDGGVELERVRLSL